MQTKLSKALTNMISETNGISLTDTIELLLLSGIKTCEPEIYSQAHEFRELLHQFKNNSIDIHVLLSHPFSKALFEFFKNFPLRFQEEHIHLTGSLAAEFIFPRIQKILSGPDKELYSQKIRAIYGENSLPIKSPEDVDKMLRLKEGEGFSTYLKILYLPKLILVSREAHREAAYHIANEVYSRYNIGRVRLKFSLSRATQDETEQLPGAEEVSPEDVILGLYDGFNDFRKEHADFTFVLSPSFRKEADFFDAKKFATREEHFLSLIQELVRLTETYPFLQPVLTDVDTIGDERELYRKEHFFALQKGFRKLQYRGFKIRSHHGETWHTLKKGIQAVDNAMNIWHIDTIEHGISLGINPNKYFQRLYQYVCEKNEHGIAIPADDALYRELIELDWGMQKNILDKLLSGTKLTEEEKTIFVKLKFHAALDAEQYQHDVLNRMIQKGGSIVALPSSNNKLTGKFEDYKEHPFSWWEKKGVQLGVGTDNYITLNTNFIKEMLILLYTDADNLKITKLLMVTTGETRRPFISHLLWKMRKEHA